MKSPAVLFAILVFVTSFVVQTASLPAPAGEALEAHLDSTKQVGTPVLITATDADADDKDLTSAAKNGGNKNAKNKKKGKKGSKGKGKKGGNKKNGNKKNGKKSGATGSLDDNAA